VGSYLHYGFFSASETGALIYRSGTSQTSQPTWFDRQGKTLGTAGEPGIYYRLAISPDDTRLAVSWVNPEQPSGMPDIYVRNLAHNIKRRLTFGQSNTTRPIWSPDGRELFYRPTTYSGQKIALKVVDIITDPEFSFRNERTLPIEDFSSVSYYRGYDIIPPDGAEFVMTFPADPAKSSKGVNRRINVVLNWFEELKERVPVD
jgi:Tol biopolymer transport system component